ncbi:hypothetical protein [Nocardioides sp. B-3]|uniref:hypothetical protein n=1 Tax=Nocardioides sp. B-3 TaxID=2895565 RepID=UPI0021533090|nr:hypothetical protein [Nocardioides sp. B-3]UUZ59800.1 hypothetical protein LP418_01515 [Nocardioides sp. B-3]
MVAAYAAAANAEIPSAPWVFGGWVAALGGWLAYNATERIASDVGREETRLTCIRLLALHNSFGNYPGVPERDR